jgi:hypothetical protein
MKYQQILTFLEDLIDNFFWGAQGDFIVINKAFLKFKLFFPERRNSIRNFFGGNYVI